MQRLLAGAHWDAEAVRDDLQTYVREQLGDPQAILVVDETGFLKQSVKSVGGKRQYSGTAGRIENCQIGVFLTYAAPDGYVLLDRELYLPHEWADDTERRQEARVPEMVTFATKPELARRMLERARTEGIATAWVTGASIAPMHSLPLAAALPPEQWQRLSAGAGAKGPRLYEWALVPLARLQLTAEERRWSHALLVRRSLSDPSDLAYYVVFAPLETPLQTLVSVAGQRWQIEQSFALAKGEVSLDQYEVRRWDGWYRHMTLAMFALAYLAVLRFRTGGEKGGPMNSRI